MCSPNGLERFKTGIRRLLRMRRAEGRRVPMTALVACLGAACGGSPTLPSTSVPTLKSPETGAVLDNGCVDFSNPQVWEFSWLAVPGATSYELFVKNVGAANPAIDAVVPSTSYRFASNAYTGNQLLDGWRWRVRAEVRVTYQEWSPDRNFSVEPLDTDCR